MQREKFPAVRGGSRNKEGRTVIFPGKSPLQGALGFPPPSGTMGGSTGQAFFGAQQPWQS
jgi:hypothetical protein